MYLRRYHDLQIGHSTIYRILKRLGMSRLPASQRYKRREQRWKRYEKQRPGHQLQIDVKFVEPITTWDEPRVLAFDVTKNPPPMNEMSPYRRVNAPHLDGYFQATKGEFELVPLPGGHTRLVGHT